jgi:hypothetical protein
VKGNPFPLKQNSGKSFIGSYVLGMGFVLTSEQANELISKDPRNKDVLFPYLNGDDLNNDPEQKPSRWVINFFDWDEEKARSYPDCYEILERLVKPERQRWKVDENGNEVIGTYALRKPLPQKWWIYSEKRPALYETISKLDQVMVIAQVSKTLAFDFVPKDQVISMMCVVFAFNDYFMFGLLQNTFHQSWVQKYASALKSDTRYTPSDVFETFPFPCELDKLQSEKIIELSTKYHTFRKTVMQTTRMGLTKIYNQFHNKYLKKINQEDEYIEDKIFSKEYGKDSVWLKKQLQLIKSITYNEVIEQIDELRNLQIKLDIAIAEVYGWTDIQLYHGFYDLEHLPENDRIRFTIHPDARREVLKRLLKLNHQLHAVEMENKSNSDNLVDKKSKVVKVNTTPSLF